MNAEFYLFNVDHGQSAALHLPNGRWCIFDLGRTASFSPVRWIANWEARRQNVIHNALLPFGTSTRRPNKFLAALARANDYGLANPYSQGLSGGLLGATLTAPLPRTEPFRFLKATVSHFHGDHLADWGTLACYEQDYMRTVSFDKEYLYDCLSSNTSQSLDLVLRFSGHFNDNFSPAFIGPNYGSGTIRELSLPVSVVRYLGGDANSRVNNASVITRIDIYGNSILLCGDMENEAWEAIISDRGQYGASWRPFLRDIDILVAPHHGHKSGFSTSLLNLAKPTVVLASVVSKDPHVDTRYSQDPVRGIQLNQDNHKLITTRQKGHIKITIELPTLGFLKGRRSWSFGDAALQ